MQNSKCFSGPQPTESIFASPLFSPPRIKRFTALFDCPGELAVRSFDLTALHNKGEHQSEELAEFYLNPAERQKFKSFNLAKRKVAWLAGRICAKNAVQAVWQRDFRTRADWHNLRISSDSAGRPFLETARPMRLTIPDISITHSGNQAAALASLHHLCGLDLQKINSTVIRVKSHFASPAELDLLLANRTFMSEKAALTMLWSGKEAVRKAFPCRPLPGFMDLRLQ